MREELDGDDGNSKAFDFVIERKNREVKIGIEEHKEKNVREEKKKKQKEAVALREQRKKIRQRHLIKTAVAKVGTATAKT